jgi:hypothetical protein
LGLEYLSDVCALDALPASTIKQGMQTSNPIHTLTKKRRGASGPYLVRGERKELKLSS